jgi:dipeptidyl aminopeptidase/acylaminoacyl peptidase
VNELYQGYPVQDDYNAQSNTTIAGQLKGHLLLEHGDIDDNVHPVETMRMVDALIKANKTSTCFLSPTCITGRAAIYI